MYCVIRIVILLARAVVVGAESVALAPMGVAAVSALCASASARPSAKALGRGARLSVRAP